MASRTDSAERRYFIGGSDAQIIMASTKPPWSGFGMKSEARSDRRISVGTF
jgi:hypothetical protein